MQALVQNDGEFSEPFEVTNWVKQSCFMAPTLFIMMFSAMLMDAFHDSETDQVDLQFCWQYIQP